MMCTFYADDCISGILRGTAILTRGLIDNHSNLGSKWQTMIFALNEHAIGDIAGDICTGDFRMAAGFGITELIA
jgi:hypothetical protein